jgi:hypothetical protein
MRKVWKWILGIVLVLVIVVAVAALGFVWQSHRMAVTSYRDAPFGNEGYGPMMQRGNEGWGQPSMTLAPGASAGVSDRYGGGGERSMMGGRDSHRFGGGFSLFGGLVKLALFVGLLYLAYWLGRRNARIAFDPKPAAPAPVGPAPEAGTPPPA